MEKFYKSKYGNLYYDLSGPEDAPVVIFLHGVGMDHRTFEKQREALRERYRTLLIDLPGHGHSSIVNYDKRYSILAAECLEGLMDEAGIDKAILVGQSLGSFISQRFQLKNPERVIAAAHIGGAEFKSYAGAWAKAFIPIAMGMINIMPKNSFYNAFGRHKADTIETQEYLIEATKKSGKKLISAITKDLLYDIIEGIPKPEYPHLMISLGETDLSFIRKNSLKWHKRMPGINLHRKSGYQPKIKSSLDKPVAGNVSAGETWNTLTTQWNRVANSAMGRLSDLTPVDIQLDRYLTEKALDGLFFKLAGEEEKIRTDPAARVTDLLKRVFDQPE